MISTFFRYRQTHLTTFLYLLQHVSQRDIHRSPEMLHGINELTRVHNPLFLSFVTGVMEGKTVPFMLAGGGFLLYMYAKSSQKSEVYDEDEPIVEPPPGSILNSIPRPSPVVTPATPPPPASQPSPILQPPPTSQPPPADEPAANRPPADTNTIVTDACPLGFRIAGDGSACFNNDFGYCDLGGNKGMYPCSSVKTVIWDNNGTLPKCPDGWTRYGDGSACTNGNPTYPLNCTLWGNPSLQNCDAYRAPDAAQQFFDSI